MTTRPRKTVTVRAKRAPSNRLSSAQRTQLILDHQRLVHRIAQRYRHTGASYEDLVGEGAVGLVKAARSYQPRKGKFTTYATPWIKKHVHHALGHGFVVRVPEKKLKTAVKPQIGNLEVLEAGDATRPGVRRQLGPHSSGGIHRAHARASLARVQSRLMELPEKERQVMMARHWPTHEGAPWPDAPRPVRAVAKRLKISPGRVSQLEQQALKRFRKAAHDMARHRVVLARYPQRPRVSQFESAARRRLQGNRHVQKRRAA